MFLTPGLSHGLDNGADGRKSHMWGRDAPCVASVPEDEQPDESMVAALIGGDHNKADGASGTKTLVGMNNAYTAGNAAVGRTDGMTLAEVISACAAGEAKAAGTSKAMADNTESPKPAGLDHNEAKWAALADIPAERRPELRQTPEKADPSSGHRT
ncbi:hypothetical protein PIB30_027708 [Stylosanthes scabra]|uniref:Uncharacterized protein n=1 Tax=Stylosanthes scabra TaxID=79078 RepID=A0ABU6VCZ6_9FABA|nr:hypothetical protein [Stylosanthes scabra]